MQTKIKLPIFIFAATTISFSGCFLWGPIKDEWQDFTAYFNTYYNGENAFEDALKDVKNGLKEHDVSLISGLQTPSFTISPAAHQNFDLAIEKASKVLQFYPNSTYTEDCLFMIGISYFYEGDNIRSGRKFIEEQSKYPQSKRFCEALMYYGDLEIKDRNYDDGYSDLVKALAKAKIEKNWDVVAQAANYLSDYFLIQSDSGSATAYLDTAATFSSGDDAAIFACKAGNLFETLGKNKDADREYRNAWDSARDIRLRFYSRYFLARSERHGKKFYMALDDLAYLRKDDKYFQFFPLIEYQKAEVMYDSGSVSSAFEEFQRIDTAYASSEAATRSAFRLGNIYLRKVGDYQNSLKYYQKCASHVTVPVISDKARQTSSDLQEYFADSYKLKLADSLYVRVLSAVSKNDSTIKHSQADIDTLYERDAEAQQVLAGFFLFVLQIPDSAINHYLTIVSKFKKSRVYPSSLYTLGEYYFSNEDTTNGRNYLTELINEHPESSFSVSACSLLGIAPKVQVDSTQRGYELAMDMENKNYPDSAMVVLKGLIKGAKASAIPQILYSIGWIYENKMDSPDSAFVYYKKLTTQFPSSGYSINLSSPLLAYEQAQRDSAEARKKIADSIANINKPVVRDSVKVVNSSTIQSQGANPLDSTRATVTPRIQNMDSLESIRRKAILDSAAVRRKQLER